MNNLYLDTSATAEPSWDDEFIIRAMTDAMRRYWRNPSSLYASDVKQEIDRCRANIAKFINAEPEEIYFTSGASEANNWALRGWVEQAYRDIQGKEDDLCEYSSNHPIILTSTIEHKSISDLLEYSDIMAMRHPYYVFESGMIDCYSLEVELETYKNSGSPILVTACMANNELGVIQDIKTISELVHKYNGVFHTDATQAFSKIPIDVKAMGIDMMSVSGHKVSPVLRGIGFLYKKNGINIRPLIYGAQEQGLRGSTEFTYGIIGLSKALEYCYFGIEGFKEMCAKRDYFIDLLESKFDCELNGDRIWRLPNNINVTFPQNITGEALLYVLDMSGIQVSTGSACNSKSIEKSHVLDAIGLSDEEAMKTVRFTLPNDITYEDIDWAIEEIDKALKVIEINL